MHRILYVLMFLVMACSNNKSEFTNTDFAGKVFSIKVDDTKTSDAIKIPVDGQMQMIFATDSSSKMRVMLGSQFTDVPVFWRVENDSMVLWSDSFPRSKLRISKEPNGFMLSDASQTMLFVQGRASE